MRVVKPGPNASPREVAEFQAFWEEFEKETELILKEMADEERLEAIQKAERLEKAKQHLKDIGIDHLVDL